MKGVTMKLEGKVAVITGAGRGIGRATVLKFAREAARVIVAEISEDDGNAIADELTALGFKAAYIHTDVSKFENVQAAVDFAV